MIRRTSASLALILVCVLHVGCRPSTATVTDEEISALLEEHSAALASGDTALIKPYWAEQSTRRDGFWYMHWWRGNRIRVADWAGFLDEFIYEIDTIDRGDHLTMIDINWIPVVVSGGADSAEVRPMRYYVIWERDRWVLANPIDALTHGWLLHESECFRFHFAAELAADGYLDDIARMDWECAQVLEAFDLELTDKIDFYVARTPSECGQLLDQPAANGYAAISYPLGSDSTLGFSLVASTSFYHPHEAIHVFQALARIHDVSATFTEGLAVAFGGGPGFAPELALATGHYLVDRTEFIPLRQLLTMNSADFFRQNFVTYLEAGAFITFLTSQYGFDALRQLANEVDSDTGLLIALERVYDMTVVEMGRAWEAYLSSLVLPQVEHSWPDEAEQVFAMVDPKGDDVGDGDYAYPNERFAPGVFDLTGFAVRKDENRAYFKLTFNAMQQPVTYGSGSEQFVPGIVIAVHRGLQDERTRRQRDHGVGFPAGAGYDVKLNIGTAVSVSDNHGKVVFTTGPVWQEMADTSAGTLTFSLPLAFVGELSEHWQYFVGVGLTTDRSMNFLFAGPAPVYPDHPVFLTGGNNADGRNPAFIDILLPRHVDQTAVLGNYDDVEVAVVEMVGGG